MSSGSEFQLLLSWERMSICSSLLVHVTGHCELGLCLGWKGQCICLEGGGGEGGMGEGRMGEGRVGEGGGAEGGRRGGREGGRDDCYTYSNRYVQ